MNEQYHTVRSLELKKGRFLFFDIFCRNNELVLICPIYSDSSDNGKFYIQHSDIKVKCQNIILTIKREIIKTYPEPIVILIYDLYPCPNIVDIEVHYHDITEIIAGLAHCVLSKKFLLTQALIFKDDYRLIDVVYDYYQRQGVEQHYLYYNGAITNEIKNTCKGKNKITLIEWNFKFRNTKDGSKESEMLPDCTFGHHAQIGQMHHALYKYGKPLSEYMVFNDCDEYLYVANKKLKDLVSDKKYCTYGFLNNWCATLEDGVTGAFPSTIYKARHESRSERIAAIQAGRARIATCFPKFQYGRKSKCIHKTSSIETTNVHRGNTYIIDPDENTTVKFSDKKHANILSSEDHMLLHISNYSLKKGRKKLANAIRSRENLFQMDFPE